MSSSASHGEESGFVGVESDFFPFILRIKTDKNIPLAKRLSSISVLHSSLIGGNLCEQVSRLSGRPQRPCRELGAFRPSHTVIS